MELYIALARLISLITQYNCAPLQRFTFTFPPHSIFMYMSYRTSTIYYYDVVHTLEMQSDLHSESPLHLDAL